MLSSNLETLEHFKLLINNAKKQTFVEERNQVIKQLCVTIEIPTKNEKKTGDAKDELDSLIELEDKIREKFCEIIILFKYPQLFVGRRIRSDHILLFGPDDKNINLIIEKVAHQANVMLFYVSMIELLSTYTEEADKLIKMIFEVVNLYAPSILVLNDLEALETIIDNNNRNLIRRCWTELLVQMQKQRDDKNQDRTVIVIGTSTKPWNIDSNLRRRFFCYTYVRLPDVKTRRKLFEVYLKEILLAENLDFEYLIRHTEGYSPRDILQICKEAFLAFQRRKIFESNKSNDIFDMTQKTKGPVTREDFLKAIRTIHRSISDHDLNDYEAWNDRYGI